MAKAVTIQRREYHAAYYRRNIEHIREITRTKDAIARKRESRLRRREAYRERHNERNRVWDKKNKGAVTAKTRRYQAARLRALPAWADLKAIERFYIVAQQESERTGLKWHVDHIVPLQSAIVCGLHCEWNLQILLDRENKSKSNRTWPGHPNG